MNIELQCCGLVVLVVLLLIFIKEKSLDLTSRRLFFKAMLSCMACLLLDIFSIVGIVYADTGRFPALGAQILCKLYVMSLALQTYEGFLYASGEFFALNSKKKIRTIYLGWFILGELLIALLPISYFLDGRVVYSYGPSVYATYATVIPLIVSTIAMAFVSSDRASSRRRWCILLWMGTWLAAAAVQFFFQGVLVVGFAAAFGVLLIYAELENPHEGVDRRTGQFTSNALSTYLDDAYTHERLFSSMHIRVEYRMKNVDPATEKTVMLRASNYLNQDRDNYVFRQSDDEFIVVYPTQARLRQCYERTSAEIVQAIGLPVKLWYTLIPYSHLFRSADEYLQFYHYSEKTYRLHDCVAVDQASVDGMREYLSVRDMITLALAEGRVEVFYQPIWSVSERRFTAAEALVRIRDTDGTIVPPGKFIPIAEENGLIVPLGNEIFRQVCSLLATGRPQKAGIEYVEVNLSVAQFDEENPAKFVTEELDAKSIRPEWINLEITETASSSERRAILTNMDKLIRKGVSFSLDDFGTGRSNLDYFVEMPVDIIKFDHSFTQGYFNSPKAKFVMESVIGLMEKMNLPIVAEGVETEEQLEAMCSLGISYIQGYYFSKPLPREEFIEFVTERNATAAADERARVAAAEEGTAS